MHNYLVINEFIFDSTDLTTHNTPLKKEGS